MVTRGSSLESKSTMVIMIEKLTKVWWLYELVAEIGLSTLNFQPLTIHLSNSKWIQWQKRSDVINFSQGYLIVLGN